MTIEQTRNAISTARSIGFTRRDLFKYGILSAGAVVLAACGGGDPAAEVVEKFAVGTWKIRYQTTSNGRSTSGPRPPVEFTLTVSEGGTFTTSGAERSGVPDFGTWAFGNGFVQITEARNTGMASNMPETMQDSADLSWSYDGDSMALPVKWDSGSSTLTITGTDANGGQFPIEATKQ